MIIVPSYFLTVTKVQLIVCIKRICTAFNLAVTQEMERFCKIHHGKAVFVTVRFMEERDELPALSSQLMPVFVGYPMLSLFGVTSFSLLP